MTMTMTVTTFAVHQSAIETYSNKEKALLENSVRFATLILILAISLLLLLAWAYDTAMSLRSRSHLRGRFGLPKVRDDRLEDPYLSFLFCAGALVVLWPHTDSFYSRLPIGWMVIQGVLLGKIILMDRFDDRACLFPSLVIEVAVLFLLSALTVQCFFFFFLEGKGTKDVDVDVDAIFGVIAVVFSLVPSIYASWCKITKADANASKPQRATWLTRTTRGKRKTLLHHPYHEGSPPL